MNTTFKVLMEDELHSAGIRVFHHLGYVSGNCSLTKKGKDRDKKKHQKPLEEARKRFRELFALNFPEFNGRLDNITRESNRYKVFIFAEIKRI